MELNKCSRCGAFFATNNNVCPNCEHEDKAEILKLKSFLQDNNTLCSLDTIACETGISVKNLNRYFKQDDFASYANNIVSDERGNVSINL